MQATDILRDFVIDEGASLLEAIAKISKNSVRTVLVTRDKKMIGVISEGDIMKALINGATVHTPLAQHINYSFKFLNKADDQEALSLVKTYGIALIPIVDKDFNLVDVIRMQDLLAKVSLTK